MNERFRPLKKPRFHPFFLKTAILLLAMAAHFSPVLAQKPGLQFPVGEFGKDYNVTDAKGKRQGSWIRVYKTNPKALYYRGQFSNGIPTGKFEFYYETGDLMSTVDHVQDSTINDVVNYNPDGKTRMSEGRYVGKKVSGTWSRQKQGIWLLYDANGNKIAEENYVDDQLSGSCTYYYPASGPCRKVQYVNGLEDGPFTEYFEDGSKKSEGVLKAGQYDGKITQYHSGGGIQMQGSYEEGLKSGLFLYFHPNGKLEMNVKFKEGKEVARRYENGTFSEYYEDGIPKSEYTYEDGKKNGPFTVWYDIGTFVNVPPSQEDIQNGIPMRQKLEGTQIDSQGDYQDDHLEGEIKYFGEDGRLIRIEKWNSGVLQE